MSGRVSKTGEREKEPAFAAVAAVAGTAVLQMEDVANRLFAFVFMSILILIAFVYIFDIS